MREAIRRPPGRCAGLRLSVLPVLGFRFLAEFLQFLKLLPESVFFHPPLSSPGTSAFRRADRTRAFFFVFVGDFLVSYFCSCFAFVFFSIVC